MKPIPAASILWRRLDRPGYEFARVSRQDSAWSLSGTAVFVHEGAPCRLDYRVVCNERWETTSGKVSGWVGNDEVSVDVAVEPGGIWRSNGTDVPGVRGAVDIDLNFSPSTNLLPIRRLAGEGSDPLRGSDPSGSRSSRPTGASTGRCTGTRAPAGASPRSSPWMTSGSSPSTRGWRSPRRVSEAR